MAKMKKMCKAAKDGLKSNEKEIFAQVKDAKYICKNCLRTANDKGLLCKPVKIE